MKKNKKKILKRRRANTLMGRLGPQLLSLLQAYQYKTVGVFRENFAIKYSPDQKILMLENIHNYSEGSKEGDCVQLIETACKQIRDLHPTLRVYRVYGSEPSFFKSGYHYYILVCESDVLEGARIAEPHHIQALYDTECLAVDPTFRFVKEFSKTDYAIIKVGNHDASIANPQNLFMSKDVICPLLLTKGELMYLGFSPDSQDLIKIGFGRPNSNPDVFPLNSSSLDQKVSTNETQKGFIQTIRQRGYTTVSRIEIPPELPPFQ